MLVVVTLGHRLNDDGSITEILRNRLKMTLTLIDKRMPDAVIVSGGMANKAAGISEAEVMRDWLIAHDVNKEMIILEDKSLNTKQNAQNSVQIAKNVGATEILLCTTTKHMKRFFQNPKKLFLAELADSTIKLDTYSEQND